MTRRIVRDVLDWQTQKEDFAWDGSWRDIYVQNATIADWAAVVDLACEMYGGMFLMGRREALDACFEPGPGQLTFRIGPIKVDAYFFSRDEVELSLDPRNVTEASLPELLEFLVRIGSITGKRVVLTPENGRAIPIFEYDPQSATLRWHPPQSQ